LEKNLPEIIGTINSIVPAAKSTSAAEVKYYTGEKGIQLIYNEALKAKELR